MNKENISLLREIQQFDTNKLVEVLQTNGLADCCDAIQSRQINGEEFLKLTELQLELWRQNLNRVQVARLWSIIQLANQNPQQFYTSNKKMVNQKPTANNYNNTQDETDEFKDKFTRTFENTNLNRKDSISEDLGTHIKQLSFRQKGKQPPFDQKSALQSEKTQPYNSLSYLNSVPKPYSQNLSKPPINKPLRSTEANLPKPPAISNNLLDNEPTIKSTNSNLPKPPPFKDFSNENLPKPPDFCGSSTSKQSSSNSLPKPPGFNSFVTQNQSGSNGSEIQNQFSNHSLHKPPEFNNSNQTSSHSQLKSDFNGSGTSNGSLPKPPDFSGSATKKQSSSCGALPKPPDFCGSSKQIPSTSNGLPKPPNQNSSSSRSLPKPPDLTNGSTPIIRNSSNMSDTNDKSKTSKTNKCISQIASNIANRLSNALQFNEFNEEESSLNNLPGSEKNLYSTGPGRKRKIGQSEINGATGCSANQIDGNLATNAFAPSAPMEECCTTIIEDDEAEYFYDVAFTNYTFEPWYRKINRTRAKEILIKHKTGSFLVRPSSQPQYICIISLNYNKKLYHFPIIKTVDGVLAVGKAQKFFSSVKELVEYYIANGLDLIYEGKKEYVRLCQIT